MQEKPGTKKKESDFVLRVRKRRTLFAVFTGFAIFFILRGIEFFLGQIFILSITPQPILIEPNPYVGTILITFALICGYVGYYFGKNELK